MIYIKMELNGARYLVDPNDVSRINKLLSEGYEILVDKDGVPLTEDTRNFSSYTEKLDDKAQNILDKLKLKKQETKTEVVPPVINVFKPEVTQVQTNDGNKSPVENK